MTSWFRSSSSSSISTDSNGKANSIPNSPSKSKSESSEEDGEKKPTIPTSTSSLSSWFSKQSTTTSTQSTTSTSSSSFGWLRKSIPQITAPESQVSVSTEDSKESEENTEETTENASPSFLRKTGSSGDKSTRGSIRKVSSQMSVQKAEKALADARFDFERKLKVLTHCMEEKAEDNVILAEQNKELHQNYVLLDHKYKHLVESNSINSSDNTSFNREKSSKEIESKLESMSGSLAILASDNIELRILFDSCEKNKKPEKKPTKSTVKEKSAKAKEEELVSTLKKEVLRLSQIEESCDESVLLYENTIKEMNKKMKSALKKEQERRKKAEFDVQRLKQKIEEIEFMLSEKEDTFSWSSNSDEEK